ncbi:MAG: response regulator [Deltaproteobacteria bacterium]|nr:MAG: response regulator [Deltaproteobacteria bacterium]
MAFNVLIVDDSSSMRNIIKKIIQMSGFDVGHFLEASNGREALTILDNTWIDVIISDIHMPEMDGVAFLQAMQKKPTLSDTPVVIVTTEGRQDRIKGLLALGARACIRKPFKPEKLRDTLIDVLGIDRSGMEGAGGSQGCDF